MTNALRFFCAFGLMLGLLTELTFAQGKLDDWKNVMALAPESGIYVKTKGGEKLHGELLGVTERSLTLNSNERGSPGRIKRSRELSRGEVSEIRALAPTTSILVGGAIGGGIGAGLGAIADATARSHEDRGLITGTLGLLGTGIGAAIGRSNPLVKGKKIYESH